MGYEILKLEVTDGIGLVTNCRPKAMNALNSQFFREMDEMTAEIKARDDVKVMIVTGEGKAFAAGADIAEMVDMPPENAREFKKYWTKEQLPFPGLPDPQYRILNLYGQEVKLLKLGRMPAQVIVDIHGMVRFAHYSDGMQDIPSNKELLTLLDQLDG